VAAGVKVKKKQDVRPEVIVYTDGACSGNPGPGGWAAVLRYGDHEREISGGESHTTNQKMELTAPRGLRALGIPVRRLHSDSAYLVNLRALARRGSQRLDGQQDAGTNRCFGRSYPPRRITMSSGSVAIIG
jgi:ribonuclease HI